MAGEERYCKDQGMIKASGMYCCLGRYHLFHVTVGTVQFHSRFLDMTLSLRVPIVHVPELTDPLVQDLETTEPSVRLETVGLSKMQGTDSHVPLGPERSLVEERVVYLYGLSWPDLPGTKGGLLMGDEPKYWERIHKTWRRYLG